jgi:hypothetical protein
MVAKIQVQGSAEAERLRDGIRKAIVALQATLSREAHRDSSNP